jgi:hypothetical protein
MYFNKSYKHIADANKSFYDLSYMVVTYMCLEHSNNILELTWRILLRPTAVLSEAVVTIHM